MDQVRDKMRLLHLAPRTEEAYVVWIPDFLKSAPFSNISPPRPGRDDVPFDVRRRAAADGRLPVAHQGYRLRPKADRRSRRQGGKDRYVPLPESLIAELQDQRHHVERLHEQDLANDAGWVWLPYALAVKFPAAGRELRWQYVFPTKNLSRDSHPREAQSAPHVDRTADDGNHTQLRRHHLHETTVQQRFAKAVRASGITKRAPCHTLRHSLATHLLEDGEDIRTIRELLGQVDVGTTRIYTYVGTVGATGVRSPLDQSCDHTDSDLPDPLDRSRHGNDTPRAVQTKRVRLW